MKIGWTALVTVSIFAGSPIRSIAQTPMSIDPNLLIYRGPNPFQAAMDGFAQGQRLREEREAHELAMRAQGQETARLTADHARTQQTLSEGEKRLEQRRWVGNLIADRRCEDARDAALRSGDFELVQEVKSECPKSSAVSPAATATTKPPR